MNIRTIFGLAAVAGLLAVAAPANRAQAMSLINPAASASTKDVSGSMTTEVRWRHHGWRRHHGWHRHRGWHRPHHWHRRHYWHPRRHWHHRRW
ncbi:MAG: hypothetical protein BGN84_06215 [Afipia sp. 62-7]|nr:hypothetical protein [Afipia sp.]OJU22098.1 MAG: hypothetical protein BGN84_06215 [Afipia sp. 62-7]